VGRGFTEDDDALLDELGVEAVADAPSVRTHREERIIAGFEEIQRWVERHGRAPQHGEHLDIFERLYAVRLERLRALQECRDVVEPLDHQGLLAGEVAASAASDLDDEALLAELGVDGSGGGEITQLRHVRSAAEKRAAEEVATRQPCLDFSRFRPLFAAAQAELESGLRRTVRFERKSEIAPGRFYILGGQRAYVASAEEAFVNENGMRDARLRVIFDNGTESNLLMRSLQRALQQDESGRRITDPSFGPLFADHADASATPNGLIYVLRSHLEHPFVRANHDVIHKIGVTGGDVERRVGDTMMDPTFLMGEVEIVATYQLFDLNRAKLESLIHRVFARARLDIDVPDRFGTLVRPQEWFLVPLPVINEAIERITDGSITAFEYDPERARLVDVS